MICVRESISTLTRSPADLKPKVVRFSVSGMNDTRNVA